MRASSSPVVELVATLIQNRCVNDGRRESGNERASADTLAAFFDAAGVAYEIHEAAPTRASLVARREGSDPDAPSLCFCGHLDVVPADEKHWTHDPFAGEIADGLIWGRGAVDMLNQTAAQAVAFAALTKANFKPRGDLIFFAPADEEAGGALGAAWMLDHHPDLVRADYVIGEGGGFFLPAIGDRQRTDPERKIAVMIGEKGPMWQKVRFSGTPGHGSMPYQSDNAIVKAANAAQRLARYVPPAEVNQVWQELVESLRVPALLKERLLDPHYLDEAIEEIHTTNPATARVLHACTHNTFSINTVKGGTKTNVIPHEAEMEIDVRVLPGQTGQDLENQLRSALGGYFSDAEITDILSYEATISPVRTPLWDTLEKVTASIMGPCGLQPWIAPFTTDTRFYRTTGAVAYGFSLHDETVDLETFGKMFHGHDEHVSLRSLELAAMAYEQVAQDFLG